MTPLHALRTVEHKLVGAHELDEQEEHALKVLWDYILLGKKEDE